jgi:membrane-bound lytic murein transglycosylase D
MPAETRNYVPKLQAVKNIIASPEQYAIVLPEVENQPYFVKVKKTRDIDIKIAAQLAELPIDEFKALNPQFNRPVITGSEETQILLPKSNAEKFKANLGKWGRALSSWTVHKITNARERIETIAARFKTTPEVIREANNIPPKMALKAGSTIIVPKPEHLADTNISSVVADNATMVVVPDVPDRKRFMVKVGNKDTLSSIARRHKVSVAQIKSWNGLSRDIIMVGQSLELHVPARVATAKPTGKKQVAKAKSSARQSTRVVKATKTSKPASTKTATASTKAKTIVASSSAKSPR